MNGSKKIVFSALPDLASDWKWLKLLRNGEHCDAAGDLMIADHSHEILPHSVTVALQILILSVKVRILVG